MQVAEKILPTHEEVETAVDLLVNHYHVSTQLLNALFGSDEREQADSILQTLGWNRLTKLDVARLLIQRKGPELFSGSDRNTRKLRWHLLNQLSDDIVRSLFERHESSNRKISSPSYMRKPLLEKKWHAGKRWPRDFVESFGFPRIFAGIERPKDPTPAVQDVPPWQRPPDLVTYQEGIKRKMLEVLERDGARTRCLVALPTGAGKTRIAVDAFIEWMLRRFAEGKYLIWIAQSEELCEQAIACFEQMWSSQQFVGSLRIYRFFGDKEVKEETLSGGVVVASIGKLYNRIKRSDPVLTAILRDTGAMIVDEAHRSVSEMYNALLRGAEQVCGPDLFPICGLTATPGRVGANSVQETQNLVGRYQAYLITPELGKEYEQNPLEYFRRHGFLARANHIVCQSGREYTLKDAEIKKVKQDNDLPSGFLKRLAFDKKRNRRIIQRLLNLPPGCSVLVYACSVEHAFFLSAILTARDRESGAISSETPVTIRRGLIERFKSNTLEFLCNFGVLTTGFDAPKTDYIVLCRPTMSEVLYEQIIGRGLRGPKFGGASECTIIDFADNIKRLGAPLAYKRFEKFWNDERTEGE